MNGLTEGMAGVTGGCMYGWIFDYTDERTDTRTTNMTYYPADIMFVGYKLLVPNHYGHSQWMNTRHKCQISLNHNF